MKPAERSRSSIDPQQAELSLGRSELWGVLNVTPDSFSDGGRYTQLEAAVERALAMVAEGADRIDVGGESSRPAGWAYGQGFARISDQEEIDRILPVVEALIGRQLAVSVDTTKAEVARAALRAGVGVINDVSCGRSGDLLAAVATAGAELVLMHTRGEGQVQSPYTDYGDVVAEVRGELDAAVERAVAAGIGPARIWIDPGIGFAKTPSQCAALLAATSAFVATGRRVLVGPSRKSFIAALVTEAGDEPPPPSERLGGSLAAASIAVLGGAHAIRAHDIASTRQAIDLAVAVRLTNPTGTRRD